MGMGKNLIKIKTMVVNMNVIAVTLALLACAPCRILAEDQSLAVNVTLVNATALGAFCLDGTWPAYQLQRGFGEGARNWLLYFEGGGWCNNISSCLKKTEGALGSSKNMTRKRFPGILSNNATLNPDFYNWNRVKLRYCDGGSFSGDAIFDLGKSKLYFKGQKIWEAIILDLLPRGLGQATKALLSGCSAGGLASFRHCNSFTKYLPTNATVKCMSDGGFFLDTRDPLHPNMSFFTDLISLQGIKKNLDKKCTSSHFNPELCFFPQYALKYIKRPFFILNSAYDYYQVRSILVPSLSAPRGYWDHCQDDLTKCNPDQLNILNGFRLEMITDAMRLFCHKHSGGGIYLTSCYCHCQTDTDEIWSGVYNKIHNKSVAEAVGDWYFDRRGVTKEIDYPYPCDTTCYNKIFNMT